MGLPWKEILGGATGSTVVIIVAALFLGKLVAKKIADTATMLIEDRLRRANELHKSSVAFASAVDTDLRTRRIAVYAELWEKTGLLSKWPRNTELKYEELHQLTRDFRDWYFKRGGMYLSTNARDAFFEVQKRINAILDRGQVGQISGEDYEAVRDKCSMLRSGLSEDILSRREAPSIDVLNNS